MPQIIEDGITSSHIQEARAGKGFRTVKVDQFLIRVRYPLPVSIIPHFDRMEQAGYPPEEMFLFLSLICLDDPWNKPGLWRRLFNEVKNSGDIVRQVAEVYA